MQDLPSTSRTLKRASGLVSSNGQVAKELANLETEKDNDVQLSSTSAKSSLKRETGIGASFRRKFQDFRDRSYLGRSKSLNGSETGPVADATSLREGGTKGRGHSRSLSEAPKKPSPPLHTNSAPPALRRNSTQVRPPPLLSVAEGEAAHHITPPSAIQTDVPIQHELRSPTAGDVTVPLLIQQGVPMTKVTLKKHKKVVFRIDADQGQLIWEGRKKKIIPIENIKEIRSGADARYYRQQFQLSQDYQDRWLTLIYIIDGEWKSLHLIADTPELFAMWDQTLRGLHAIRKELMQGLGNFEVRQAMWEKQYWKGADQEGDEELSFEEVEKLCRKLNINTSRDDLERLFTQADRQHRQFLDFEDFRKFVKLLKGRPEIERRYKKLRTDGNGHFDFDVFAKFMIETQKSLLHRQDLRRIFDKYSTSTASDVQGSAVLTLDAFTSFLLSSDNSAFADQHRDEWHDMTHPLPEYFISSSHNTYLVGHQLVGDSTIEGYIRALLQGCRSVEVDIYDGEDEPMIFHGKTLTSKVSLREVCQAIMQYGFVASPYPIIISAEVHCGLVQQELIAKIMIEVFGEALVKIPPEGLLKFEQLPSPTDLKGRILFKTKNPSLSGSDTLEGDSGETTEPSSSASDSDAFYDAPQKAEPPTPRTPGFPISPPTTPARAKPKRRNSEQMKEQFTKARTTILQRVRSVRGASSTSAASPALLRSQVPPSLDPLSPVSPLPNLALSPTLSPPPTALIRSPTPLDGPQRVKPKLSFAIVALLVYTVGVKCRGINKKEEYAPEHMFSLSENAANRMLRFNMRDLIKHTRTHLVRTYPKGTRLRSTNYDPHRFWAAGAQVVAINWQTFDLGYMINHAMFQRNGRTGYVLKPAALRQHAPKELLNKQTRHTFDVTVISAQQLPRPRSSSGKETSDKVVVDPFVEVTLFVPDWPVEPENKVKDKARAKPKERGRSDERTDPAHTHPRASSTAATSTPARTPFARTSVVKKNGFNPVWEDKLSIPFDCVGDMFDLIFVKFAVKQEDKDADEPLAVYCASLGSLQHGYRHIPLHDSQLSQYLYSTLFVKINVNDVTPTVHV